MVTNVTQLTHLKNMTKNIAKYAIKQPF